MVRLVVLTLLLILTGCTQKHMIDAVDDTAQAPLPMMDNGRLAALDEGESHPALISLYQKAEQARQAQQWQLVFTYRSEERRVGKECKSRSWPELLNKDRQN